MAMPVYFAAFFFEKLGQKLLSFIGRLIFLTHVQNCGPCVHQGAPMSARSNRRFLRFADGAVGSDAVTTMGAPARFSRGCDARRAPPPHHPTPPGLSGRRDARHHCTPEASDSCGSVFATSPEWTAENTRAHTPSEGVISLLCVLRSSTAEPDVMQIIFDCCCQARRQHHTVKKREKKKKTNQTLVRSFVCVFQRFKSGQRISAGAMNREFGAEAVVQAA